MHLSTKISTLHRNFTAFSDSGKLVPLRELLKLSHATRAHTQQLAQNLVALADSIQDEFEHTKLHSATPVAEVEDGQVRFFRTFYSNDYPKLKELAFEAPELLVHLKELFAGEQQAQYNESIRDTYQDEVCRLVADIICDIKDAQDPDRDFPSLFDPVAFDAELLGQAAKVMQSKFFKPESYLHRADQIRLVAASRPGSEFPSYIRARMREVADTYICGQFISAIASSRALLEFAIADRASSIGFQPYRSKDNVRLISLHEMIMKLIELRPNLQERLERIQEEGNSVLHPPRNKSIRRILPNDNLALRCVNNVFDIVSELYSKKRRDEIR